MEQDYLYVTAAVTIIHRHKFPAPNGKCLLEVPSVRGDREEKVLGIWQTELQKKITTSRCWQPEVYSRSLSQEKYMRGRALGVERIVHIESMNDFLMWPYTPKQKGKRLTERQPIEITSEKSCCCWQYEVAAENIKLLLTSILRVLLLHSFIFSKFYFFYQCIYGFIPL